MNYDKLAEEEIVLQAIIVSAHHLEQLARKTSNAALKRKRDAFQARWGHYWKCSKCGGRGMVDSPHHATCANAGAFRRSK